MIKLKKMFDVFLISLILLFQPIVHGTHTLNVQPKENKPFKFGADIGLQSKSTESIPAEKEKKPPLPLPMPVEKEKKPSPMPTLTQM